MKSTRQDKAPNFDLVIFDCDGVLVDSEVISCRVHADVLTRHGYPITAEQVHRRFLGRTARDATAEIERELGRPLPESYDLERRTTLLAALADTVEAIPYLHAALDAIDARICVASSAAHDKIFTTLSRTGLYQRFAPHIFSGTQVSHGKPAPDLFLFAAR
ncbi:MAG: HAD hydrolase-like protein, partial [Bradyrhizobium sp.]